MSEEELVRLLIENIRSGSRQVCFGTDGAFACFSDGRFLERADTLPPAIDKLRYEATENLPTETIRKIIPQVSGQSGEIPGAIEQDGNRYRLLFRKHTCVVESICYAYLKMRYPEARIICLGRNKPVIFLQNDIVRAILMPIRA
jgi:hypothetical protein